MKSLSWWAVAVAALGCATDPILAPRDCTPGTTSACVCPGASGVQACTAEGRVGACVCVDAGVLPDAVTVPDAPPATDRPEPPDAVTVRDAGLEDAAEARADVPPTATDAAAPGDATSATDAQVSCEGPIPRRCSSSAHCQAMCVPSGINRLPWCCTPGGECIPNLTSTVCPWR